LADKAHGTKTVLEVLAGMDVNPDKIWIDHVEEQTIESVLMPDTGPV
jgi:predicted metal-dependent TIM-barrel fold hydrolase